MPNNRFFNHCLICALILVTGLGLAFVVPLLASTQGLAAQGQTGEQVKVPEAMRYYVAKTGDGSDGSSWSKAFTKLQDALGTTSSGDEIWVATGVYTPGETMTDSFSLVPGVALYGGFAATETVRSERDWEKNVTVLSGDIDGDDDSNVNGVVSDTDDINGNNSYHVVWADGTTGTNITESTKLDGFTITAGQANGGFFHGSGGGFYCDGSGSGNECSPSLSNVSFSGNSAGKGGAMYNYGYEGTSSPSLREVIFYGNTTPWGSGGAMVNNGWYGISSPSMNHVTFTNNLAHGYGGAMQNSNSSPTLINVTFSGNYADDGDGGAMENTGNSSPTLTNVVFSGNKSAYNGGAMYNNGDASGSSSPILTNVTFSGNSAIDLGGAMYNSGWSGITSPELYNCILWNNQDENGTGTISSTIYNGNTTITLTHSLIEGSGGSGGSWIGGSYVNGGGNIDEDPMFVTPIDPSTAPTTTGNLRLKTGSPAIDAGDNTYIAGFPTDLDGEPRKVDGNMDGTPTVDMGAYEYQIYEVYVPIIYR